MNKPSIINIAGADDAPEGALVPSENTISIARWINNTPISNKHSVADSAFLLFSSASYAIEKLSGSASSSYPGWTIWMRTKNASVGALLRTLLANIGVSLAPENFTAKSLDIRH